MPQFGKLLLRFLNPREPPDKHKVFQTIQKHLKLPLTGLREIGGKSVDELKQEIKHRNPHLEVHEIIKFGRYTHVFKIEFATINMASHALQCGILCESVKIAPSQIQQEKFIDILICFNCYKMEQHATKDCPTPNLTVCSECTGNHTYKNCTSSIKKYLNCQGDHRTMAMSCPTRKTIIKNKTKLLEEKAKEKQEQTYAKALEKTIRQEEKQAERAKNTAEIMSESGLAALIIILDAHVANIITPGSYNSHINKILKRNNIQPIELETNPDSKELFNNDLLVHTINVIRKLKMRSESDTSSESQDSHVQHEDAEEMEEEVMEASGGREEVQELAVKPKVSTKAPELKPKPKGLPQRQPKPVEHVAIQPASIYDITIYAIDGNKRDLSEEELSLMVLHQQAKYYLGPKCTQSQDVVKYLFENCKIKEFKETIVWVGEQEFKKIRSGTQRTPGRKGDGKKICRERRLSK
ncbi:hypothetical protein FHG87_009568 [Trinorchestia longiramus]|nr:hypothetical protein FHG87_009568 [Trinorchestia longiramus]